jgi:uncharacterized protein (TIGR00255 family)
MLSMTGFGRAEITQSNKQFEVEIKTVNHRYLDINLRIPRNMGFLEEGLRQTIKQALKRGRIEVFVNFKDTSKEGAALVVNRLVLESYLDCFREVEDTYKINNDITMTSLIKAVDIFVPAEKADDEAMLTSILIDATGKALENVKKMRASEGEKMRDDILMCCGKIEKYVQEVERRSPDVVLEYKEKLEKRLEELLGDVKIDENKIATEVGFLADRSCVAEETTRLNSHMQQLRCFCDATGPIGRKLDFLVQEMNREANTIGSKSNDLELTNIVVEIKSEIEKIREQVQNIE